jgi:hypothetical protein
MANRGLTITVAFIVIGATSSSQAETKNATSEALRLIRETADGICVDVAQSGKQSHVEISGDISAKVSGLAQKLADLGISGGGKFEEKQYEGLLREQLGDALKDVRNCKANVFMTLVDRMIPKEPPPIPRDPDGLYQYGEKVAEGQGAVINQANGIIEFQMVRSAGKADPSKDFEFRDWIVNCPGIPVVSQFEF